MDAELLTEVAKQIVRVEKCIASSNTKEEVNIKQSYLAGITDTLELLGFRCKIELDKSGNVSYLKIENGNIFVSYY